jgi:hypothetical protein
VALYEHLADSGDSTEVAVDLEHDAVGPLIMWVEPEER